MCPDFCVVESLPSEPGDPGSNPAAATPRDKGSREFSRPAKLPHVRYSLHYCMGRGFKRMVPGLPRNTRSEVEVSARGVLEYKNPTATDWNN